MSSEEAIHLFTDIYEDENNYDEAGILKPEAVEQIQKIDFSILDIDQIEIIENAVKLPDELALSILKRWMFNQNSVLSNIRGNLLYSPKISSERFREFIETMKCPARQCNCIVNDILEKIATGGGNHQKVDLIDYEQPQNGLIGFDQIKSSNYNGGNTIINLFDFNPKTTYTSASLEGAYFTITLPPFLKVNLTSYKLISPPPSQDRNAQGGIKSWKIIGFNRKDEKMDLDIKCDNNDLKNSSQTAEFKVNPTNLYYRNFTVMNTGENHQKNNSIILSGFDISGTLMIEDD